ncbi:MAG: alpha,alpha-trehalase, partial [Thermanaerothrix sp.]|nr:alpha,alpha-trehalase [Thermanaerothrix sp.]
VQDDSGFIDWRPGLGGQRGRYLAQPLLATLAWRLFPYFEPETTWWAEVYPRLLAFYRLWFEPEHDRDQDGFPEWDHPYQSGLENSPMFRCPGAAGYGVGSPWLESPALAAWLYREGQTLIRMAAHVRDETALPWLQARLMALRQEVEASWDGEAATYRYRDAQTHLWPAGEVLLPIEREGEFRLERALLPPRRLMFVLEGSGGTTLPLMLTLRGKGPGGVLEVMLSARQMMWRGDYGVAMTAELFTQLDEVVVQGLPAGVRGRVISGDYRAEDLGLLLPLWAGIPSPQRAAQMVERTLIPRYLRRYGLSLGPAGEREGEANLLSPLWNTFLGEGLLRYGYRDLAADLMRRLLEGIGAAWAQSGDFWAAYDAESGHGLGERHAAHGLAPLGLFLRILGLLAISPQRVILVNGNPFRQPITVQYQGITVQFLQEYALVTFPGYETIKVEGHGPHQVVA